MTQPWWLVPAWLDVELRRYLTACDAEMGGGEHGAGQARADAEAQGQERPEADGDGSSGRPPSGRGEEVGGLTMLSFDPCSGCGCDPCSGTWCSPKPVHPRKKK